MFPNYSPDSSVFSQPSPSSDKDGSSYSQEPYSWTSYQFSDQGNGDIDPWAASSFYPMMGSIDNHSEPPSASLTIPSKPSITATTASTEKSRSNDPRYTCPVCESDFGRETDLKRHYVTAHRPKIIECPHKWCGRVGEHGFRRKDHFQEHLREVHKQDIPKASNRRNTAAEDTTPTDFKFDCLHKGCGRTGVRGFTRWDHYLEHLGEVHEQGIPKDSNRRSSRAEKSTLPESKMDCPHGGCGRTGRRGFTRRDHYNEHLREVHKQDISESAIEVARRQHVRFEL